MATRLQRALATVVFALGVAVAASGALAQTTRAAFSRSAEQEITFQESLLQYSRGQLSRAEAGFRSLVEANPGDAEAHYYLGLTLLDQRRPAAAVESFNRSLRLDPTPTEVRAARATALIRQRKYAEAREDVAALEGDERWRGLSAYLRGRILFGEGDLEGAARAFAEAKALGGEEAAAAEVYEGRTYLQMRDYVRARRAFRESALGIDRDPALGEAARQLDAALAAQQRRAKDWEVQLTLGYEYDSNAILISPDIAPPDEISDESDTRFILIPRGSYSFYNQDKVELGVEAIGYFTWYNDLTDFNVASYQGGPFFTYRLARNWIVAGRYAYNYIESGHDGFMTRHIVTPSLTWIQPDFGHTSVFYQAQFREFLDPPSRAALDRDGQIHMLGVSQGIRLGEILPDAGPANLELTYRYQYQETEGDDFDAHLNSVGAVLYTPLPFWEMRFDIGATASFDHYRNPNSLDDDGDEREDFRITAVVGLNKEITEWCTARVDYTYTDRDSNVELQGRSPYDYDRHQVGARLIFSY